jgi:hypothetical protein
MLGIFCPAGTIGQRVRLLLLEISRFRVRASGRALHFLQNFQHFRDSMGWHMAAVHLFVSPRLVYISIRVRAASHLMHVFPDRGNNPTRGLQYDVSSCEP